jgi:hypothetical protein
VAVALQIGEHLGGFAGFVIVAGFYLVVGVGLIMTRSTLTKKIEKKLSSLFNKKKV